MVLQVWVFAVTEIKGMKKERLGNEMRVCLATTELRFCMRSQDF